jgi:hypothetical protein
MILLSCWGFNQLNELVSSGVLGSSSLAASSRSPAKVVENEKRKVSFIDKRSSATTSSGIDSISNPDVQSPYSKKSVIKPIDLKVHFSGNSDKTTAHLEEEKFITAVSPTLIDYEEVFVQMYKMQVSCYQILKILMYGTPIDNFIPVSEDNSTVIRSIEFTPAHVVYLFLCGVQCAR